MFSVHHRAHRITTLGPLVLVLGLAGVAVADDEPVREGPFTKDAYPTKLIYRPLTLPQGMVEAALHGGYWWIEEEDNIASSLFTARVGVTDNWRASVYTSVGLTPDTGWREWLGLSTRYLVLDTGWLDVAPGIYVPFVFADDEDAHLVPGVSLGATTRFYITKRIAVYLGNGLVPIGIGRESMSVNLNYSVVVQLRPHLAMRISSQMFHIRVYGDVRESSVADRPPSMSVFYSPNNRLDFTLTYAPGGDWTGLLAGIVGRI